MITEFGEKLMRKKKLEAEVERLEQRKAELEGKANILGFEVDRALSKGKEGALFTHLFVVEGVDYAVVMGAHGKSVEEARNNLGMKTPAATKIGSHLGEVNDLLGIPVRRNL